MFSSVPSEIARVQQELRQGVQLGASQYVDDHEYKCEYFNQGSSRSWLEEEQEQEQEQDTPTPTHKTQPQPGIWTQLLPFLFSRQIEHENAVAWKDEWSCEALYVLRSVWNVDGGSIGGTERLEKEVK